MWKTVIVFKKIFKVLNPWHLIRCVCVYVFPADSIKAISLTDAILVRLCTEPE